MAGRWQVFYNFVQRMFYLLSECLHVLIIVQVFHAADIPGEFGHIYKRLGLFKYWLLHWFSWLLKILLLAFLGPKNIGMHTCYGDGTEIAERHLNHVRDTVWNNLVFNRWEQGDVLMIDNFRVSHGRQVRDGLNSS